MVLMATVTITDHGAVSGAADNTAAIQAAHDACADGDTLRIPPGTFRCLKTTSPWCVRITKRITIQGDDRDTCIIEMDPTEAMDGDPAGNANALLYFTSGASGVTIRSVRLEGNKDGANGPTEYAEDVEHHRAMFFDGTTDITIYNVSIRNFTGDAAQLYNSVERVEISYCLMEWCQRDHITLSPSSASTPVRDVSIHHNTLRGASNQQIDNEHGPAYDVEIYENVLEYAENENSIGLVIAGAGTDSTAPSLRWNVHHNTILGAIRFTWTSDSVIADNVINNPRAISAIELERVQSGNVVARNTITQTQTSTANLAGIYMNGTTGGGAEDISIDDNEITVSHASAFGIRADSCVSFAASGNTITGAGSAAAGFHGIRVRSAVDSRDVESVHISDNTITGFGAAGVALLGNGAAPNADILVAKIWGNRFVHGGSQATGIALNADSQDALQAGLVAENTFGSGVTTTVTSAPSGATMQTAWAQTDGAVPRGFCGGSGFTG